MTFYRIIFSCLLQLAKACAPFVPALKLFLSEREKALSKWSQVSIKSSSWWFHVASVGELEQIRPILETLKNRAKGPLVLTYFSPSVPRLVKKWDFVDFSGFLPLDRADSMAKFLDAVRPKILVLNRYDLWPEMLTQTESRGIKIALINASTPPLGFFGSLGLWFRRTLFTKIKLWTYVDTAAATAWESFVLPTAHGLVAGDPRVDRTLARAEVKNIAEQKILMRLSDVLKSKQVFVCGSTWPEDENLLLPAFLILKEQFPEAVLVIVPHEPGALVENRLQRWSAQQCLKMHIFSNDDDFEYGDEDIILINARGYLAEAYRLGQCAYVGGGFTKHVHSVIEPLAHGLPVALGPKCLRSPEVATLEALGAAFIVQDPRQGVQDLAKWVSEAWQGGERLLKAKSALALFTKVHRGAGERVANYLIEEM